MWESQIAQNSNFYIMFLCFCTWAGQYIDTASYRDVRRYIVTDFGYRLYHDMAWVLSFPGWKGFTTVKWCDFLNLPDCSCCSLIHLYPLIHIFFDYLSKFHWVSLFCEITNSHPHNTVSVPRYLVKNTVIFNYFITSAAPTPQGAQQVASHNRHDQ